MTIFLIMRSSSLIVIMNVLLSGLFCRGPGQDLIRNLMVVDPRKRLTAQQALEVNLYSHFYFYFYFYFCAAKGRLRMTLGTPGQISVGSWYP
jgi:hypothetical protein